MSNRVDKPDSVTLLEQALFLRQNGERAPGGTETWRDWLMPSDLREQARTVIRGRKERERQEADRLAIEAANLTPEVVAQRAELVRQAIAAACVVPVEESPHPKFDAAQDRKARKVACPWCKAPASQGCVNTATQRPVHTTHELRLIAAGLVADPAKAAAS